MKNYKIIGLTGQSGAGKSTVARLLENDTVVVINADLLVAELYKPNSICIRVLSATFGEDIINPDGTLNRPILAQKAFSSKENTKLLNSIVHPFVLAKFAEKCKNAANSAARLIVFDAPQLFESGADVFCDKIISVTADTDTRLERICNRDKISHEQALMRINAQYDENFFKENSDYTVNNNDCIDKTKRQIEDILSEI